LVAGNFNPFNRPLNDTDSKEELTKAMPIIAALKLVKGNVTVSESTKRDLKFLVVNIEKAIDILGLQSCTISKISKNVEKQILKKRSVLPQTDLTRIGVT
jgi:hypothetical protein